MIISGANNLYNNRQAVDALNVFPVPDGDTGTNMSLTVAAMAKELEEKPTESLTKAADMMSFATLRGARGNSGVILSQFFRGISKSLKGKTECTAKEFAEALSVGSAAAYKAVMKPTEGTILTVSREVCAGAAKAAEETDDIASVITAAVERGNDALSKTPEMLPVLKQAGVVDAGGQGWMYVLEGALYYLTSGNIIESTQEIEPTAPAQPKKAQESISTDDIKFKYCTEFLIEKYERGTEVDSFREAIAPKGDCMLVIDDDEIVKVHIHTNNPGFVLEEAVKLGEMINLKIDNMKHQHRSIIKEAESVPDNNPDSEPKAQVKPKKAPKTKAPKQPKKEPEIKEYGFVAVCAGKGMTGILKDLGVDRVIEGGQTMNPSTDDILKAVKRIKAKTVFVFPNNKNIIMAANQAAELVEDKKMVVIPSRSVPQCVSAMIAFNAEKDAEANEKAMNKAIKNVGTGQITFAVRDTEIEDVQIKKGDILGMVEGDITAVGKEIDDVLEEIISRLVDEDTEMLTIYYGKDVRDKKAAAMAAKFEEKYADDEIEVSLKRGGQPLYYYIVSAE